MLHSTWDQSPTFRSICIPAFLLSCRGGKEHKYPHNQTRHETTSCTYEYVNSRLSLSPSHQQQRCEKPTKTKLKRNSKAQSPDKQSTSIPSHLTPQSFSSRAHTVHRIKCSVQHSIIIRQSGNRECEWVSFSVFSKDRVYMGQ